MKFRLKGDEIQQLYVATGNAGCLVSNRITVDGEVVGYMYREKPDPTWPDSGWRFLAGDETEEYLEVSNNINIFDLNTICNYDSCIMKYLESGYGVAYIRVGDHFVIDND